MAGLRGRRGVEQGGRGVVQLPGPHRDSQVSSVELLKIKVLAAADITVISITLLGFHRQVQGLLLHTEHGAAGAVQARAPVLLLAGRGSQPFIPLQAAGQCSGDGPRSAARARRCV